MVQKTRPYQKLGQLLTTWREETFRSGLEMFRELKLSFGYRTYKDFEKGNTLPAVEQLIEISTALKKNPADAVMVWAEVQMPTKELRNLFNQGSMPFPKPVSESDSKSDFSKTWVFGKAEHDFLLKEPWFFELCLKLVLAFPNEVTFKELGFESQKEAADFVEQCLGPWVSLGRIQKTDSGIRAVEPYVFLPQTSDWNDIREKNFSIAYQRLSEKITPQTIQKRQTSREIITRCLTTNQVDQWIEQLKRIESQFRDQPGVEKPSDPNNPVYSFLYAFAPRELRLPAEVLQRFKNKKA